MNALFGWLKEGGTASDRTSAIEQPHSTPGAARLGGCEPLVNKTISCQRSLI